MTALHKNNVSMTVTSVASAGLGTITLNAASSGSQSFASAYGANATVDVRITDGTAWEVARNCTYTHIGTTLTRGTLEASSTGSAISLTSAAVVSVVMTSEKGNSLETLMGAFGLDPIAVTAATTATIGRMHLCTGTTADYTVTLPAASGNAGKLIGFRMGTTTSLTKLVTLDGNASETIDGALTRIMWSDEAAILLCDGSNWFKIAGKSVPMVGAVARNTNQTGIVTATITKVACATSKIDNSGTMVDTTNNRVYARRAGVYIIHATALWVSLTAASTNTQVRIHVNNDAVNSVSQHVLAVASGAADQLSATLTYTSATNDYVDMRVYHTSGSNQSLQGNSELGTYISVTEVLSW